mmetsp:Transcript_46810/g.138334  ORF Transcript_46810/g.138334 Transcript_46810/m.138334 type:complete len:299 (-) Transcript_46810:7-903(-)
MTKKVVILRTFAAVLPASLAVGVLSSWARSECTREVVRRPSWMRIRQRLESKEGSITWYSRAGISLAPTPRRAARDVLREPVDLALGRRCAPAKRAGRRVVLAVGAKCSFSSAATTGTSSEIENTSGTTVSRDTGAARGGLLRTGTAAGAARGAARGWLCGATWTATTFMPPRAAGLRPCTAFTADAATTQIMATAPRELHGAARDPPAMGATFPRGMARACAGVCTSAPFITGAAANAEPGRSKTAQAASATTATHVCARLLRLAARRRTMVGARLCGGAEVLGLSLPFPCWTPKMA